MSNLKKEMEVLKSLAKLIPQAQQVKFTEIEERYVSVYFGFGSGNVTVGYEKFKGGKKPYMFMHCIVPKKKLDISDALTCMEIVFHRHKTIEIYYGDNLLTDHNNSRTYDPVNHTIKERHLTKRTKENLYKPLRVIETVLAEFEGTEKTHHKKTYRPLDYDKIYQNL